VKARRRINPPYGLRKKKPLIASLCLLALFLRGGLMQGVEQSASFWLIRF
jgi:hypothetical protein